MYLVLKKGIRKVQVVKEETYALRPTLYRRYEIVKRTDSWKDALDTLRQIKSGKEVLPLSIPAQPVLVKWNTRLNGSAFVYGLYDDEDKLLYIGVTANPSLRCENHIISGKRFSYMKVQFTFNSRAEADSFERFAIATINPPINILVEGVIPGSLHSHDSLAVFGQVSNVQPRPKISSYKEPQKKSPRVSKKRKTKTKNTHLPTELCTRCGKAAGKNNRVYGENDVVLHLKPCKSKSDLQQEEDERVLIRKKNRELTALNSKLREDSAKKCKYCSKPVSSGRHMPCRRRRMKELGLA